MAQVITNSGHDDMIHDAVLDYYGRRLATCSSDKTIKIFEVEGETHRLLETLRGHDSAVWSLSWAHPKYAPLLASSSNDARILIWRPSPTQPNAHTTASTTNSSNTPANYQKAAEFTHHTASVNIVQWAPHELGCLLACASSDGRVSVVEFAEGQWGWVVVEAHGGGANSVSWAPATGGVEGKGGVAGQRRFVSGGSDCAVRIWEWSPQQKTYISPTTLSGHTDWVRDVAWAPSILSKSYIASCSQDKTVRIWTSTPANPNEWKCTKLDFDAPLWRVSWSLSGNVLAVSGGDNKVSLWKEDLKGEWSCVKWIEE